MKQVLKGEEGKSRSEMEETPGKDHRAMTITWKEPQGNSAEQWP